MDKLEYDSLHKFLVSLGLIFIAFPFVMLYLFFNCDLILISQTEYEQLSSFSQDQISHYQHLMKCISIAVPIACGILFIAGIVLLATGIKNWKTVQENLDAVVEADRTIRQLDVEKMKSSEKLGKVCEEVKEAEKVDTPVDQLLQTQLTGIKKYLDVEDRYFTYVLSDSFKRRYFLRRNLRIGKYEYDGIAVSMTNNIDIIYEIKYWKDQPSETVLANTLKRLYNAGVNYEGLKHRNFHCILAVITSKDAIERMRSLAERIASDNYCVPNGVEIHYVAEENI